MGPSERKLRLRLRSAEPRRKCARACLRSTRARITICLGLGPPAGERLDAVFAADVMAFGGPTECAFTAGPYFNSSFPRRRLCRIARMGNDTRRQFEPKVPVFRPDSLFRHLKAGIGKCARRDPDQVRKPCGLPPERGSAFGAEVKRYVEAARRGTRERPGRTRNPLHAIVLEKHRNAEQRSRPPLAIEAMAERNLGRLTGANKLQPTAMARGAPLAAVNAHANTVPTNPSNSRRPSVPPCAGSIMRSGWGIMPSTLPSAFKTPAISRAEPLTASA